MKNEEITDFSPLFKEIENLDSESLVVFDVDETLIVPKDKILRPSGANLVYDLTSRLGTLLTEAEQHELRSITLLQREINYTDPTVPHLFQKIKEKKIPAMALTALFPGKYGVIPLLEQWREEELKRYGIDFGLHTPFNEIVKFEEFEERSPIFYQGILCSSHYPKGIIFKKFLEKTSLRPSRVIFIDDTLTHITSVESELQTLNIPFTGFHFLGVKKEPEDVSLELAQFQFHFLLENKTWLSDEEALKRLPKKDPI